MTMADKPWRVLVDDWLRRELEPGMDAKTLYEQYTLYGEDPWILGGKLNDPVPFRAWQYVRGRCEEMCRSAGEGGCDG